MKDSEKSTSLNDTFYDNGDGSVTCRHCGKIISKAGFRGPFEGQLSRHLASYECMLKRLGIDKQGRPLEDSSGLTA